MQRKHKAREAYFKDVLYELYRLLKRYDAAVKFEWVNGICYYGFLVGEVFAHNQCAVRPNDVLDPQSLRDMLKTMKAMPKTKQRLHKFMLALIEFCEEYGMRVTRSGSIYINSIEVTSVFELTPYYIYYEWQHFDVA